MNELEPAIEIEFPILFLVYFPARADLGWDSDSLQNTTFRPPPHQIPRPYRQRQRAGGTPTHESSNSVYCPARFAGEVTINSQTPSTTARCRLSIQARTRRKRARRAHVSSSCSMGEAVDSVVEEVAVVEAVVVAAAACASSRMRVL